jgi:glycosyltransferase involved in cell wall biosynthesis
VGVEDFTICIGTFGGNEWVQLAHKRAVPSAEAQGCKVIHRHARTLARARNDCVALADTEFVVHLDADDELEPGYIEALAAAEGDVRVPRVSCIRNGRHAGTFMPRVYRHRHACTADCLQFGNWIVVGAGVRRQLVLDIGGWLEWDCYEDFCLWQRCWLAGAEFVAVPDAIYRQHLREGSRNHSLPPARMNEIHEEIERHNGVSREAGWSRPPQSWGYVSAETLVARKAAV